MYGYSHPTIAKLIQELPGAKELESFEFQHYELLPCLVFVLWFFTLRFKEGSKKGDEDTIMDVVESVDGGDEDVEMEPESEPVTLCHDVNNYF